MPYWLGRIKRIGKTGMVSLQFYIKIFRVNMAKSVLDNSHWDKISHSLTSIIYQSNIYYSKIYQEEIEKKQ